MAAQLEAHFLARNTGNEFRVRKCYAGQNASTNPMDELNIPGPTHGPTEAQRAVRPIILTIDVEPDQRKTDARGGWEGSIRLLPQLEEHRSRLEKATGRPVQFNWFIRADPQIRIQFGGADYVAAAWPDLFKTIDQHGDYAGVHVHLWRWNRDLGVWFNDFRDPDWLAECLVTSLDGFRRIFSHRPEASRFGDHWLNQTAVHMLTANGVRYDLTIEPGRAASRVYDDPLATDLLPDFRRAPRAPYRPHADNFLIPHPDSATAGPLWMIPLTTSPPFWAPRARWPFVRRLSRSPNLAFPTPWIAAHLDRPGSDPLVLAVRSGDLSQPEYFRNFFETLGKLELHPAIGRCEFTNPAIAIERLAGYRSQTGNTGCRASMHSAGSGHGYDSSR